MDFKDKIADLIHKETGLDKNSIISAIEIPPDSKLGDYAFPCFTLAKTLKKGPQNIAVELQEKLSKSNLSEDHKYFELIDYKGAYLNFFVNKEIFIKNSLNKIWKDKESFGMQKNSSIILIESPGPNTNKPLHLGHLRNMLLGQSIYNISKFVGKDAHIVNVINDRGVHICKSMLAYMKDCESKDIQPTPESENIKGDHFVGNYYVKYQKMALENPEIEKEVQEMLLQWENNNPKIRALWEKMNSWVYKGFKETYKKIDFNVEKDYYESDTYQHGREIILEGFNRGLFTKDDTGSIIFDLEDKNLGKKVLLR